MNNNPSTRTIAASIARSQGRVQLHEKDEPIDLLSQSHELEAHIEALRELDKVRRRSAELREEGLKALEELVTEAILKTADSDMVDYVTALRVLWQLSKRREDADSSRIQELAAKVSLDDITRDNLSVLLAAEIMQALASVNKFALSQPAMLCWYWIIREIYSAAKPDWCIGGARAAHGGWVTAYATGQCVRAVLDFADSLKATGEFFAEVGKIAKRLHQLSDSNVPEDWRKLDKQRLSVASRNTLLFLSRDIALDLEPPQNQDLEKYVNVKLPADVKTAIDKVWKDLKVVYDAIKTFRKTNEQPGTTSYTESETGHRIAWSAIKRARDDVQRAMRDARSAQWEELANKFTQAGERVRGGLEPTIGYLSTVIDRQLGAAYSSISHEWEPAELACAAAAYCALSARPDEDRDRLRRATSCLCHSIAADGRIPNRRPFHAIDSWIMLSSTTVLTAVAELIKRMRYPLDAGLATKMLPYFEETRAERQPDKYKIVGWSPEYSRRPRKPGLVETADAVQALATVNRMLDEGINDIILEHFSVKYPGEIKADLDDLFYPDYGFALAGIPEQLHRESVAIMLQKMRFHITRPIWPLGDRQKLHSLVLHGPAGTGKTTLVEALARTCKVPLIEVTPSDIAKGGEAAIEQRARTVFEALALLTRVVILFDEFDPVLKRREAGSEKGFNIFSFLTPGMLPKLKTLSDKAKDRSVAYVLITNLIGTLDEAAVRRGRFDEKVGIYPPDPLSRYGHFMMLCGVQQGTGGDKKKGGIKAKGDATKTAEDFNKRVREVIWRTAGQGMTALVAKGWFRLSKEQDIINTPLGYVFYKSNSLPKPWPEPEDRFDGIRGKGSSAEKEYLQWGWLKEWDNKVPEDKGLSENDVLNWPRSDESRRCVKLLDNDLKTKDQRLLIGLLGDEILLRWKDKENGIFGTLGRLFTPPFNPDKARYLCHTHILSPEDLYIFKRCAEQALTQDLFKDTALVSHIVYVCVLTQDFLNQQRTLAYYLEIPQGEDKNDRLESEWNKLKEIYNKIDKEMIRLYSHLEEQHDTYMDSSEFLRRQISAQPDGSAIEQRMQKAVNKRLRRSSSTRPSA